MNEQTRTIIHVAVAAVIGLAVVFEMGLPFSKQKVAGPQERIGQPLFKDFTDPLEARSLEIVKFNEKDGTFKDFRVARIKGRWVIPSQDNYPADAQDRLKEVATTLIDLKPIGYASEVAEDHELFGVREPKKGEIKAGDQGVGELITVQNEKGDEIFKLIVGKEVAGDGENPSGQRFVRKPGEDIVWVVPFDLSKLPLEFDQWIEKDLLQLNALDVAKVTIKDYNVVSPEGDGRYGVFPRMNAVVSWDTEKGEWKLDELQRFAPNVPLQQNKPIPDGLGEQEELNKQKLDDLKSALDDLKIVNVERKPKGIEPDLRITDELRQNREALISLQELGFFPTSLRGERLEIVSSNGEILVDMKDGVQYVLRFGNRVDDAEAIGTKNRYLFVSAQLSPDLLTPPKLEPEPAGPEATPAPPAEAVEKTSGGGGADQGTTEPEQKDDAKKEDEQKEPEKTEPAAETTDPAKPGPPPAAADPAKEALEKIRKENRRKLEDWEDRKKKATNRVNELNLRFADWYYVIAEDVYKKIRLTRADIIKESSGAKDEGYGIDAFRKLETDGIKMSNP
jgi:hypothetical protein